MTFSYEMAENHITQRSGLAPDIKQDLPTSRRADWPRHPHYHGMASHLLSIHRGLTRGAQQLADAFALWQTSPREKVQDALMASRLKTAGSDLIRFAHNHHRIEDRHLFPTLTRQSAPLAKAVALLHADHEVLDQALDDLQANLDDMETRNVTQSGIEATAKLARDLSQIISRHIEDEEEIIVPWLLENRTTLAA